MAKRRTRKQKTTATRQYSLPKSVTSNASSAKPSTKTSSKGKTFTAFDLYDYDTQLIKKDLLKTLLVSSIILALQLSIYYYLK